MITDKENEKKSKELLTATREFLEGAIFEAYEGNIESEQFKQIYIQVLMKSIAVFVNFIYEEEDRERASKEITEIIKTYIEYTSNRSQEGSTNKIPKIVEFALKDIS